ncbi:MAG: pseudouridine synthase [Leptospirales bacterium]
MAKRRLFPEKQHSAQSHSREPGHTVDRWISKLGLGSRGMAREWIQKGRLSMGDGRVLRDWEEFIPEISGKAPVFLLDGRKIQEDVPVVLGFNKPRGVIVTRTDPQGRPTPGKWLSLDRSVISGADPDRIMPVGRLDQASSGLILLTNRPAFLAPLIEPERKIPRQYRVQIRPALSEKDRVPLVSGVWARECGFLAPTILLERANARSTWLLMTLLEGQNREIRRMLEWGGYEILHLIRVRFGPFLLGDLRPGSLLDLSQWFLRDGAIVLDIILDSIKNEDIIELKEGGGLVP